MRFDGEARTIYNGKQPDWENPIGWIEIQGQMKVTGKMAEIFED